MNDMCSACVLDLLSYCEFLKLSLLEAQCIGCVGLGLMGNNQYHGIHHALLRDNFNDVDLCLGLSCYCSC